MKVRGKIDRLALIVGDGIEKLREIPHGPDLRRRHRQDRCPRGGRVMAIYEITADQILWLSGGLPPDELGPVG